MMARHSYPPEDLGSWLRLVAFNGSEWPYLLINATQIDVDRLLSLD